MNYDTRQSSLSHGKKLPELSQDSIIYKDNTHKIAVLQAFNTHISINMVDKNIEMPKKFPNLSLVKI